MRRSLSRVVCVVSMLCLLIGFDGRSHANDEPALAKEPDKPVVNKEKKGQQLSTELIPTFGPRGSRRSPKYIAGDRFCATLKVSGLKPLKSGAYDFATKFALLDQKGHFVEDWGWLNMSGTRPSLGGSIVFIQFSHLDEQAGGPAIQVKTTPGEYQVRTTLVDNVTHRETVTNLPITILPTDAFGVILLRLTQDRQGTEATDPYLMAGQVAALTFGIVNHTVVDDRAKIQITVSIADQDGAPVGQPESRTVELKADDSTNPRATIVTGQGLVLNRPGRFTIELKLQDLLAKPERTVTEKIPIVVVDPAAE